MSQQISECKPCINLRTRQFKDVISPEPQLCLRLTGNLWCKALPPEQVLSERDIHPLCGDIGLRWRDLGRELEFTEPLLDAIQSEKQNFAKECCIAVLNRWMGREGRSATAGKLQEALNTIQLQMRSAEEEFIGVWPQNVIFSSSLSDILNITINMATLLMPIPFLMRRRLDASFYILTVLISTSRGKILPGSPIKGTEFSNEYCNRYSASHHTPVELGVMSYFVCLGLSFLSL